MMEVDGKSIGTVVAAVVAAGIVGAITSEINTARAVAGLEARLDSLKEAFLIRVQEAGREHEVIRDELAARIDRVEGRLQ